MAWSPAIAAPAWSMPSNSDYGANGIGPKGLPHRTILSRACAENAGDSDGDCPLARSSDLITGSTFIEVRVPHPGPGQILRHQHVQSGLPDDHGADVSYCLSVGVTYIVTDVLTPCSIHASASAAPCNRQGPYGSHKLLEEPPQRNSQSAKRTLWDATPCGGSPTIDWPCSAWCSCCSFSFWRSSRIFLPRTVTMSPTFLKSCSSLSLTQPSSRQ